MPWLYSLLTCFQTNLIVGDFFKSDTEFLQYADKATELISWLHGNGKTYILALLREVQQTNSLRILAVIRAVLTRWTAHYLAYCCLFEIHLSLQILVENDEKLELRSQQLLLGDASAREWSQKNIAIIKNSAFWHALARYARVFKYGITPTYLLSTQNQKLSWTSCYCLKYHTSWWCSCWCCFDYICISVYLIFKAHRHRRYHGSQCNLGKHWAVVA